MTIYTYHIVLSIDIIVKEFVRTDNNNIYYEDADVHFVEPLASSELLA